ncbi:hypothetical protein [Paraburkholderia sp.]|uniref:hypothetical protein n=1 Tax=Paraburkholderia sp. TaxID=1926495 RepID=UPI0023A78669|nr:hypothetical protein [Paraburkholderia sp.]MDE1184001.1 hypothetical protein [Paraburkholderia sp.]
MANSTQSPQKNSALEPKADPDMGTRSFGAGIAPTDDDATLDADAESTSDEASGKTPKKDDRA